MDKQVSNFIDEIIKMLFLICILLVTYDFSCLISDIPLERLTRLKLLVMIFIFITTISIKIFKECFKISKIKIK